MILGISFQYGSNIIISDRSCTHSAWYHMHCYLISFHMHCYLIYRIAISHCYPIVRNTCHTQLMNWMISCKSYLATCAHLKRAMNETRPQSLLPRPCEMEVRCRLMWDAGEMHVRCTVPKYPDLHALFVCLYVPALPIKTHVWLHQLRCHHQISSDIISF